MSRYFYGWYFRCQSDQQTLAIIASYHKAGECNCCEIQFVTETEAFRISFPFSDLKINGSSLRIANNHFGTDGVRLNIQNTELRVTGNIRFGPFTKLQYDIMGPFRFLPFMQCRHSVYSMHHMVNGKISINGQTYSFHNDVGYMEGDRGRSFPTEYVWTQCSFPEGALMLSIADIPLGSLHFTGVIGIVYLNGMEYRLATYLGAKAIKIKPDEIIIRQGRYALSICPTRISGHPLHAPVSGAMIRTIHEHPSCRVYYRFAYNDIPILELDAANAAFEYEY